MTASEALNGIVSGTAGGDRCPGCGTVYRFHDDVGGHGSGNRVGLCRNCGHVHITAVAADGSRRSRNLTGRDRMKLAAYADRDRVKAVHDGIVARLIG